MVRIAIPADDPLETAPPSEPEVEVKGNGAVDETETKNVVPLAAPTTTTDVFANLDALRLKQDFNRANIKKPFNNCPLRKPRAHEWFQAHPELRFETKLFALKEDMSVEWYLPVGDDVTAELDPEALFDCVLFTWINRKHDVSLLPVQLYDVNGRDNDWWASMRDVMTIHATKGQWIRIHGGNQGYDLEIAENEKLAAPRWPNVDLTTILRTAFKGRVIDHVDHQVIARSMRGRI